MKKLQVVAASMAVTPDIRQNSRVIQKHMQEAATRDVRLVQFPEGALSGYVKTHITHWSNVDWVALEDELDAIKRLAKRLKLWVVLGSAHRLPDPERPYNSLYVISDNGTIYDRYDKRILSFTEANDWFSPGDRPCIFEVDGVRVGLALCIEIQFYELFAAYRNDEVDLVLISAHTNDPMFEVAARAHASLNTMWLGLSVPVMRGSLFSQLVGPDGVVLAKNTEDTQLAMATLDPEDERLEIALQKARPWRKSVREQLFSESFFENR